MKARKTIGSQRRCPDCMRIFVICTSCDRGHRYCSSGCKVHGRRESWKRSTRIYRQTPPGKFNHCERQKRYRKNRQLKISETQHPLEKSKRSLQTSPVQKTTGGFGFTRKPVQVPFDECSQCHRVVSFFVNSS